jgi:hypothetical protein
MGSDSTVSRTITALAADLLWVASIDIERAQAPAAGVGDTKEAGLTGCGAGGVGGAAVVRPTREPEAP